MMVNNAPPASIIKSDLHMESQTNALIIGPAPGIAKFSPLNGGDKVKKPKSKVRKAVAAKHPLSGNKRQRGRPPGKKSRDPSMIITLRLPKRALTECVFGEIGEVKSKCPLM